MEIRHQKPRNEYDQKSLYCVIALTFAMFTAEATGQVPEQPSRPTLEELQLMISDTMPQVRVESIDHERIATRRIDIVDENGTIRLTLAADTAHRRNSVPPQDSGFSSKSTAR